MSTPHPTGDQVQELHQFIQDRNQDEWQQALADDQLPETHLDAIRRLSNSYKLALAGTAAYLLATLAQGRTGQAAHLWGYLTSCGEQWQDHPGWNPAWANPQRAQLLQQLTEGTHP